MSANPKRPADPVLAKLFRIADLLLDHKKQKHTAAKTQKDDLSVRLGERIHPEDNHHAATEK